MKLNELRDAVYKNACEHGFHDEARGFGDSMALIHSEVSEAFEEFRNGHLPNSTRYVSKQRALHGGADPVTLQKPEGIPSELADILIRVLDTCGQYGIDIEAMVTEKMAYNATRPFKHGKLL